MKIAVLGVGLIGGSIGLAAREHVEDAEVTGYGRDRGRLERALELGAIDRAADSLADALDGAQLCFACAPPKQRCGRGDRRRLRSPKGLRETIPSRSLVYRRDTL